MLRRTSTVVAAGLVSLVLATGGASASSHVLYEQDFTEDADGWRDGSVHWYGTVTHRPETGTAVVEDGPGGAPFSEFDGYRSEWPGDYVAEIAVHLDPQAWRVGEGFDYTVANSRTVGGHLRDHVFHVGVVADGRLLVNTSHDVGDQVDEDVLTDATGGEPEEVTAAGWYTLRHRFTDVDGSLVVELELLDDAGAAVLSHTLSHPDDTIGDDGPVGGNRSARFGFISVGGGIEVDDHRLYLDVAPSAPSDKDDCRDGGHLTFGYRNQGLCIAALEAGDGVEATRARGARAGADHFPPPFPG